ncbi:MAG: tetratricopeptide repeat protein [Verrucomicrobia bacterium]|nr:tetratricopeptide repeat protein [Verrucomicrobiota bacterium]
MKTAIISVICLTILGLIVSYLILPSKAQLALMELKAHKLHKPESYYKELYVRGDRSVDDIAALILIYEQEGEIDRAIAVLKQYVQQHPDDLPALKKLADLYLKNQQYDAYFHTLLVFQERSPTLDPEVLQIFISWYDEKGDERELMQSLLQLMASGHANESHYLRMSELYVSQKHYQQAQQLLAIRREFFKDKVALQDILFEAWIDHQMGQTHQGSDLLAQTLLERNSTSDLIKTIDMFVGFAPEQFSYLAGQIQPLLKNHPLEELAVLHALWDDAKQRKYVEDRLEQLTQTEGQRPQFQNLKFVVYLSQNEDEKIEELIPQLKPGTLETRLLISFCVDVLNRRRPYLAQQMQQAVGATYLHQHPVIQVALKIAAQDADAQKALEELIDYKSLTRSDRFLLFRVAAAARLDQQALQLAQGLPPYLGMNDNELLDVALAYIQIKQPYQLYPLIENACCTVGAVQVARVEALLDLATGQSKKFQEWLSHQAKLTEYVYLTFYAQAEESKQYEMALLIAEQQLKNFPSDQAEANYALALVQVGQTQEGMGLLEKMYQTHPASREMTALYFRSLVQATKNDKTYQRQLVEFMEEKQAQGGIPLDLQRDFASAYLEVLQDFPSAKRIFKYIAEQKHAQMEDLQSYVYLIGPRPLEEEWQWIENRVCQSSQEQLGNWLEILNNLGCFEQTIELYQIQNWQTVHQKAYFAYLDALAYQKHKYQLTQELLQAQPFSYELPVLEKLSAYAEEAEEIGIRRAIWECGVQAYPCNPRVWEHLAKAASDAGDYRCTIRAYRTFFHLLCSSQVHNIYEYKLYASFYNYGMAYQQLCQYGPAKQCFLQALAWIEAMTSFDFQQMQYKALILYQLNQPVEALNLLYTLYELSGRDPNFTANYANMLMDEGHLALAKLRLQQLFSQRGCYGSP